MTPTTPSPESAGSIGDTLGTAFRRGIVDSLPFLLIVGPFAAVFGVVGTEAGLPLLQVMTFSVLVIAGASQLTALQLMSDGAPAAIVLASALAVNLRMAMYSASLAPWIGQAPLWQRACAAYLLVDQSYTLSITRYERERGWKVPHRMIYFLGTVVLIAPAWYSFTLVGALVGRGMPDALSIDFAVPVAFIALVAPALRTFAHLVAASVGVVLGLALAGLPWNLGLLTAGLCAMAAGAEAERRGLTRALYAGAPK